MQGSEQFSSAEEGHQLATMIPCLHSKVFSLLTARYHSKEII